jgi:hypothetical protein
MIPVPLLNPKFATMRAEKPCELRVRGTGTCYRIDGAVNPMVPILPDRENETAA